MSAVGMCVCVCVHCVHMFVCMFVSVFVCLNACVCMCPLCLSIVCVCVSTVCMFVCACMHMHACLHVCPLCACPLCVCPLCVCVCVCVFSVHMLQCTGVGRRSDIVVCEVINSIITVCFTQMRLACSECMSYFLHMYGWVGNLRSLKQKQEKKKKHIFVQQ